MSNNEKDQDALAAQWAAELEKEDGSSGAYAQERLASEWAAALEKDGADNSAGGEVSDDDRLAAEWASALAADEQAVVQEEKTKKSLAAQAHTANFTDMTEAAKAPKHEGQRRELDFILDIPLDVSAELGRTRLLINELLQLGQGSVVELNKLAGEPLEVYVNGKLIARGEAVVINEKFGVRLTDIISPIERVKQLG